MNLTLALPDAVFALLGEAPERTIYKLIKAHLAGDLAPAAPRGRRVSNAERDAAIADKALAGKTHAAIANEYNLSTIRVSQIVSVGKAEALIRNPNASRKPAPKPIHNTTKPQTTADILKDWYEPEPERKPIRNTPAAPIYNPAHAFEFDMREITG